ncbi:Methionine aminopeptidase 1 [Smittium mucronatum]|uniref:Methionine aminopeptidase n=1 Tax=Smittium mucronatum TaxID=133383 RepID=A0A1R0GTP5_9FUNG|nr:Methionine aminopeptidase 1 [Smittium mucronatum]
MEVSKTCIGVGCGKPAKMQCPTCLKLDISSYFCDQDCFKRNWTAHKLIHQNPSNDATYDPFPSFRYTGALKAAYPLSKTRIVPDHIMKPDYAQSGIPISEKEASTTKIQVLNQKEIDGMKKVCRSLNSNTKLLYPDQIIHDACIERDSYPSPLNYYNFPKSVCTSLNEVICHGIPDRTVIKNGDLVNLDVTLYHNGFHGDLNETYIIGEVNKKDKGTKLVLTAKECLEKAIKMVKPGTLYRDLGTVIESHAKKNGFSVVRSYCGHGINSLFHCAPNVPHYANNRTPGIMQPGHVFTIEPMINEGVFNDTTWPDNWTAVTRDGKRSAQFEHTILVTEKGCEVLTARLPDSPGI